MSEVVQVDLRAAELLERLRHGELPETWLDVLDGVDPALALLIMWTGRLARVVDARYTELLRPNGLQYSDYATLTLLRLMGPTSPSSIQEYLVISSGGTTKTIDRLVARGLAERRPDPDDGRGVVVHPTSAGVDLHAELFRADAARQALDLERVPERERDRLVVSLRSLLDALENE